LLRSPRRVQRSTLRVAQKNRAKSTRWPSVSNALEQQAARQQPQSTWQARCASCGRISASLWGIIEPFYFSEGCLGTRSYYSVRSIFSPMFGCRSALRRRAGHVDSNPCVIAAMMQKPRYAKSNLGAVRNQLLVKVGSSSYDRKSKESVTAFCAESGIQIGVAPHSLIQIGADYRFKTPVVSARRSRRCREI